MNKKLYEQNNKLIFLFKIKEFIIASKATSI